MSICVNMFMPIRSIENIEFNQETEFCWAGLCTSNSIAALECFRSAPASAGVPCCRTVKLTPRAASRLGRAHNSPHCLLGTGELLSHHCVAKVYSVNGYVLPKTRKSCYFFRELFLTG